ncbi:MAG: helix-turn-helix transcriptional regulator [Planctomycetota bacterium]|jgi:DNA-binding XRE family transcriptional regulator|nr:helix-turn-helix transcriptional regulator [Planctomycetota bacterium]
MSAHTKARTTKELTEIRLKVPARDASRVRHAIGGMLALVGRDARLLDEDVDDEAIYSFEEAFPDSTPGRRLRGLRTREGITQKELAEKLGIRQHHVSEMECGTRKIGLAMAKRMAKTYNLSHRAFL